MPPDWDVEADVVVVGFGAAGACAALEAAAAGRSVLILDRFGGGGATALSGGVVYAGGGTPQQHAAGVTDTPEAMFGYLRTEVGDAVPAATLREFCDGSAAMLAWLEGHGVPFEGSLCPDKTSYPTNRHYLYYSGSELSAADVAPSAPRGHRTRGRGTSGGLLYARLAAAVAAPAPACSPRPPPAGWSPDPAAGSPAWSASPCAARPAGSGWPTASCTAGRSSRTCTCPRPAASCTGRSAGWSGGTRGRCGSARRAAWCWRPAVSPPTGR